MHRRTIIAFAFSLSAAAVASACSEANDVVPKNDASPSDATTSDASASDATTNDGTTPTDAGGGDAATGLVFNELSATGGDWIEIYNPTAKPVDLGGFKLADNEPDAGTPRLTQALVFAQGTQVASGSYLVVVANEKDASSAPVPCFDGGVPQGCPVSTFGISKDNPNTFYLLAPNDAIVVKVDMAAGVHASGESWGRFPNGSGDFAVTKPTPGQANQK